MQHLLDEIEHGALNESVPLTSTFTTCLALARKTDSFHLRDWARSELKGYGKTRIHSGDWTPPYRRNIPGTRFDREQDVHMTWTLLGPVNTLESAAASTDDLIYKWEDSGMGTRRAGAISVEQYRKIVEQIRTALVALVTEVRETPTQEALDRAVTHIRTGDHDTQIVITGRIRQFFLG